jgi:histidine triad (HIT) family protein
VGIYFCENSLRQEPAGISSVHNDKYVKKECMKDAKGCPFCKMARHELPAVVIQEDNDILVIMDLYPATLGHILVLPKQHIENIYQMSPELGAHIMAAAITVAQAIKQKLSPDGLNLIQSNETVAGQTISHFHLHVVPRYSGDSVLLKFGHGSAPAKVDELERVAFLVKSALTI